MKRDLKRIPEILQAIGLLWVQHGTDQLRVGQLLCCAARTGGWTSDDIFNCEDDVILKGLHTMIREKSNAQD